MIIDTHAHIDDNCFDGIRDEIIETSLNSGITKIINPSISEKNFQKIEAISKKFSCIYSAYGLHPLNADEFSKNSLISIESFIKYNKKAIAIGEIGLDFKYDSPNRESQVKCFTEQVKLAVDMSCPILIHCRRAFYKVYTILKKYWNKNIPGIMHAYSGSIEMAENFIKLGFFISISGSVTYPNAKKPIILAQKLPLTSMVIETDSPDMTPHAYKGEKNKPFYIRETLKKIACLRNSKESDIEETIYQNSLNFINYSDDNL